MDYCKKGTTVDYEQVCHGPYGLTCDPDHTIFVNRSLFNCLLFIQGRVGQCGINRPHTNPFCVWMVVSDVGMFCYAFAGLLVVHYLLRDYGGSGRM